MHAISSLSLLTSFLRLQDSLGPAKQLADRSESGLNTAGELFLADYSVIVRITPGLVVLCLLLFNSGTAPLASADSPFVIVSGFVGLRELRSR